MFNNSSKIMFFGILMMGTLISISANSWLGAWMGLEINLLAFIPLMSDDKLMSTEASLKYFLTQALASSVFLFAVILFLLNSSKTNSNYFMEMMIFSSLLLKSGSAPFHFWFPNVMEGLSWTNALILMTWQKIAPLMLISYIIFKPLIITSIILSSLIGALGGLNQTSLRKLMAYSSINHLGWMLAAMYNSNLLWMTYFLFYSFLSFAMIFMFNMFKTSHINQLFSLFFHSKVMKFFLFFNLLSLGGLPPFLGFFPKWIVIQSLTINNQLFLLTFMVLMTLITLYFYMRLSYSAFMLNYYENNWLNYSMFKSSYMKIFMTFSFISIFGLFLISSLYFLF
ncbi:NADH dehydrogenase subunit 2 (mitochondrion) [Lucilia sericata]|uniref:NADH-ubiquinone oxidoreductase chain 2 n=2 Tax=Lucilia TaxID=7374 RepID=K4LA36_LUCCU|nr:NADH dehydrogenase subunit 2 [Lucilia sericata]AFV08467.1 NADH dehydrogenase subunit 2 [Lucilia cuprina]AFV08493.1 NADH dehydrogenase subunit 2 [Lucilia cuprina]AFV08506.1 NADH dehydrogenase subunit 2 [Lucilia cuprina]AFV08532.1 NADH dehydrogenase subunit 2 [Lucilia sericata]AFV08545.1 NADH dehydrogenase subunit 2 [Lucilia sericata]